MELSLTDTYLGIDIGGTKISLSSGTKEGKILKTKKFITSEFKDAKSAMDAILEEWKSSFNQPIKAIGIACPGPIDKERGIIVNPPNLKGWKNFPIVDYFSNHFEGDIFFNNDGNAAILAEYQFGKYQSCSDMIYLSMSTGIGGGIITSNTLLQGITDTGGEVGHMVLDPNGPLCACGLKGCLEVYCGGIHLEKEFGSVSHFFSQVREKEERAINRFAVFIKRLAQAIGILIMSFNPRVIFLGTIVNFEKDLILEPLKKLVAEFCWNKPKSAVNIEVTSLQKEIGDLGAIALSINP